MTDEMSDNDPVSVNVPYTIEIQDPQQTLSNGEGHDDFFVCRKCNKVFNNLSEYVEHKVKEENFSLGQTRAKSDQRILLPHLFEKRKRKAKQDTKNKKMKTGNESAVASNTCASKDDEGSQNVSQIDTGTPLKKLGSDLYSCTLCTSTFKREAALRWHLKRDHKSKDSSDDSNASEDEVEDNVKADESEDFTVEHKKQQIIETVKETKELKTQEIVIVIENSQAVEESGITGKSKEVKDEGTALTVKGPRRNSEQKRSEEVTTKSEKVFSCELCGRSFKELTVLKAHALVHSEDRQFICAVENCPYAFKTKGGLVRHMRRHTGDRPFNCDKCGRSFTESGSLTRHLKARLVSHCLRLMLFFFFFTLLNENSLTHLLTKCQRVFKLSEKTGRISLFS
ncbi:hypothetical protein EGW08_015154 [Elysia chlorotica]|uniref:C2H2-type domain-containing protein n=1 Tax=Elysia chlorotica TaxID=188477 RepID=A0A433T6A3_ELYCH|nr:hypothetical protein EGW08_015154 [Elysia chlorotica]